MISVEQDIEQSMRNADLFADFLDSLFGDAGCARRSGGLRPEPCSTASALRAPAAIAKGEKK